MTENEKIKAIRNHFSLTMESFGEKVGLKRSAVSLVESGRNSVSNHLRTAVCREFKVSEAWLKGELEGNEIIFEKTPADDAAIFASDHNLDKTEEVLIREYLKLSDGERAIFRKYLKNVLYELNGIATAADQQEKEIQEKLSDYEIQLRTEAASEKSEASRTGIEGMADEA